MTINMKPKQADRADAAAARDAELSARPPPPLSTVSSLHNHIHTSSKKCLESRCQAVVRRFAAELDERRRRQL